MKKIIIFSLIALNAIVVNAQTAYITNSFDGTVSVINVATNTVTATIAVGSGPEGVSVSPDGSKVYIANYSAATVNVINTATNTVVDTISPVGSYPRGVSVSPVGNMIYVTNYYVTNSLSVINTVTDISDQITVGTEPVGVSVSPDGNKVYVTNYGGNSVSVINTATNTVSTGIAVGTYPQGISISPDGSKVYVANEGGTVSVINTTTNTVSATIAVGNSPIGISVSPDGSKVYVSNFSSSSVSVINTANNTVSATITVGTSPYGVSVSPDGSKVYVANYGSNTVSVINTATNTVTATITVGNGPVAFGNFITKCNTSSDTVASACNSFTWNDSTYTSTPTIAPNKVLTNKAGCDSTVTLNLSILANTGDTTAIVCNSFTWNDSTYTSTPTIAPIKVLTNKAGCDSIVTLYLTFTTCGHQYRPLPIYRYMVDGYPDNLNIMDSSAASLALDTTTLPYPTGPALTWGGWYPAHIAGTGNFVISHYTAGNINELRASGYKTGTGNIVTDQWYISPYFSTKQFSGVTFSFSSMVSKYLGPAFIAMVSTKFRNEVVNPADWDTLTSAIIPVANGTASSAWIKSGNISIDPIKYNSDSVCVAFRYTSTTGAAANYYIDSIKILGTPISVGIKNINTAQYVSVYPNPSSGEIQVISNQCSVSSIEIYNLLGEKVYTSPFTVNRSPITINVSDLPSGVYVIEVITDKGIEVRKFKKE